MAKEPLVQAISLYPLKIFLLQSEPDHLTEVDVDGVADLAKGCSQLVVNGFDRKIKNFGYLAVF